MTRAAPPAAAADIATTLSELERVLAESAAMVRRGDMVELSGLDRELQSLLETALTLPPSEARGLLPFLDRLLGALDAIESDLKAMQGASTTPETASRRIRAVAAYRKPEGL